MIIEYNSSVFLPAKRAWRSITVRAKARELSPKMVEVVEVVAIDGEAPTGYASRTGSKSQTYNAAGIAEREKGAKKRLGTCSQIAMIALIGGINCAILCQCCAMLAQNNGLVNFIWSL